ncbi:MAG: DUF6390 family protein [Jatrophihabitantaceae bacterium]
MDNAGAVLFARYAYAPNELGYCGPEQTATLLRAATTGHADTDLTAIASCFSGAWPYAVLLANLAGVADPLDEQVMRAYWTGGPLLERVDHEQFGAALLEFISGKAGHYWGHLSAELLPEAAPTHGFHVFGVYPWSRLLTGSQPEQPLHVLDNCRIRYGQVVAVVGEQVVLRSQHLTWDGCQLGLGPAAQEQLTYLIGGESFVGNPVPGDWLAVHWDLVCERLTETQLRYLRRNTGWQLRATNARLARQGRCVA